MDAVDKIVEKALTDIILAFGIDDKSRIPKIKAGVKRAIQQEIAKARIDEVNKYVFGADARVIQHRIAELSQTLKEREK